MYVRGSLGVAIYPDDGANVGELLRHADSAMYHAKSAGRNQFLNVFCQTPDTVRGVFATLEVTLTEQYSVSCSAKRIRWTIVPKKQRQREFQQPGRA